MTRHGSRPTRLLAAAAALAVVPVLAAGCAGAPAGDGEQIPPSDLVGLWRVSAEGESEDTWLQIGSPQSPGDLTLWRECGASSGWWRAGVGAVLTSIDSWSGSCGDDAAQVDWLLGAQAFAADGDDRLLLDASGEVVATLSIDGEPPADPDVADDYRVQPELTEEQLAELDARPQELPDDVEPAEPAELLGRWVPLEEYGTEPYLELADDGTWSGSDGCNGLGGRWLLDAEGAVLVTSGAQTLIGCEGEDLGTLLVHASWLVVDDDELTFYDAVGAELGQATRG